MSTERPDPSLLYERIYRVRSVEERLIEEYGSRRIRMALHLSIGQEAVAVGTLSVTRPTDTVIGTHRSHALYLGKGGDLQAMIDEFYSLPSGCSRGFGGSMHLAAPDVGMLGATAVVGGGVPLAVGQALAHKRAGDGNISIAFTGDGGIDEGSFWEALNLAAVLRLPVLFLVENNGYSTLTSQVNRQASLDLIAKGSAFGVESLQVDGNDVMEVAATAAAVIGRLRSGQGPFLLEATTFRYVSHVGVVSDWGAGRPVEECEQWPACDPVLRFEQSGLLAPSEAAAVRARVDHQVDDAFQTAIAAFEAVNAIEQLAAPPPPNPSRV